MEENYFFRETIFLNYVLSQNILFCPQVPPVKYNTG